MPSPASLPSLLSQTELPFFGYDLSGLPLGLEDGYREVLVDENLEKEHDPLVKIPDELLQRPIYFERGFTKDARLFLRQPAIYQWLEYDRLLQQNFGWRVRIADAFRPWTVQQQGFNWGISEVVKNRNEMSIADFKKWLLKTLKGEADPKTLPKLEAYIYEADHFFAYVACEAEAKKRLFPQFSEQVVAAGANLGLIDIALDQYAVTPHSTGGQVDCEWLDERTGLFVNVGVPVDQQGLESAMPFFEDRVATILEKTLQEADLVTVSARQQFYREQVRQKPSLQMFLKSCGVDVEKFLTSSKYFYEIWEQIKQNRRIVVHSGSAVGLKFYGFEAWDATANDARGGVRCTRKKIVSGSGIYARQMGQSECAWGNATRLWEKIK